jgi:hypothetical protein
VTYMRPWKIAQIVGVILLPVGVVVRVGGELYGMHLALRVLLVFFVGRLGAWFKSERPRVPLTLQLEGAGCGAGIRRTLAVVG